MLLHRNKYTYTHAMCNVYGIRQAHGMPSVSGGVLSEWRRVAARPQRHETAPAGATEEATKATRRRRSQCYFFVVSLVAMMYSKQNFIPVHLGTYAGGSKTQNLAFKAGAVLLFFTPPTTRGGNRRVCMCSCARVLVHLPRWAVVIVLHCWPSNNSSMPGKL